MTAPTEQTLFEKIEPFLEQLYPDSSWRRKIKEYCTEQDKRLAEAEERIKALIRLMDISQATADSLSEQLNSAHAATRDQIEVAQGFSDELERVRALIVEHNEECVRICGDKSKCGYANYDRRCGDCAKYWMIEMAAPQQEPMQDAPGFTIDGKDPHEFFAGLGKQEQSE
jgi:hypothetical protein